MHTATPASFLKYLAASAAAIMMLTASICANAQTYPSKPLHIIVAYPPGGVSDNVARALAERLATQMGQSVIVENRGGAGGSVGIEALVKAVPDGYTLGFAATSPLVLSPHLGHVSYDALKDVVLVASVMFSPVVLLGTGAFTGKDFAAVLAQAKASPGALRWATSGLGSVGHVALEQLKAQGGIDITHVPYRGASQQLTDALGGQFELLTTNMGPSVTAQINAGKLLPLAVGAPRRIESLPKVPTFAELGYPKANLASIFGVFAPTHTPEVVITRLNAEINKALETPQLRERMTNSDNVPTGGSAAQFAELIGSEYEANGRIVKEAHIRAE